MLLLLHSLSILRDDSDVANLVVPPWGVISKSQSREFPGPTQSIPVDTASNVIKHKRKYNRPRRRKRILSCHGCKKVYKRKTWLLKHKETCVKMKYMTDIALGRIPSPLVSHSQPTANRDAIRILMWNVVQAFYVFSRNKLQQKLFQRGLV